MSALITDCKSIRERSQIDEGYSCAMGLKDRIATARLEARINKSELARRCGVDHSAINHLENERTKSLSGSLLVKMSAVLSVQPEWLESGKGDMRYADDPWPNAPPPIASEKVVQIGRRSTDECPAISEIINLMHGMDDAGRWILVGAARQIATQHPVNKQASSSQ